MTGINRGLGSGSRQKGRQNLEHGTRIGGSQVRSAQAQTQKLSGIEPNRQWGWEPYLEQTEQKQAHRQAQSLERPVADSGTKQKAASKGSRTRTRRMGKESSLSNPKARAPERASCCSPSCCFECFWEGRMQFRMLSDLGLLGRGKWKILPGKEEDAGRGGGAEASDNFFSYSQKHTAQLRVHCKYSINICWLTDRWWRVLFFSYEQK